MGGEKANSIRSMFASIARHYDLLNTLFSLGTHRQARRAAAALCNTTRDRLVLDVAVGTGDLASEFARQGKRVIGVDFCLPMLERVQEKFRRSHFISPPHPPPSPASHAARMGGEGTLINRTIFPLPGRERVGVRVTRPRYESFKIASTWKRCGLVVGDALTLPFRSRTFDCAATAFSLRNIPDLGRLFSEMVRVTRPGGKILCLELTRPRNPVLRWAYLAYLFLVPPLLATLIYHKLEPYRYYCYLARSVAEFPEPEEIARLLSHAGTKGVTTHRFAAGILTAHLGMVGNP